MVFLRLASRNLLRNPGRSFVMMATVAIGVAALFMLDGLNYGTAQQYRYYAIHLKYGHGQLNTHGYRGQTFEKPWDHWIDQPGELLAALRGMPEVAHVFPRVVFYGMLSNGHLSITGKGLGGDYKEEAEFFNYPSMIEGEPLAGQPDGVALGVGLARALAAKVGTNLTLLASTVDGTNNSTVLRVVGVFHTGMKDFDDHCFRLQLATTRQLLDTERIESIAIGLKDDSGWDAFARKVGTRFPALDATAFEILDKVYYQTTIDWLNAQFAATLLIVVVIIMLGITNTISYTVLERREEIGNLRANGDAASDVMTLLLYEGVLSGVVGATLGLVGAYLINTLILPHGLEFPPAPGFTRPFYHIIELRLQWALYAAAIGVGVAALATLLAGWRQVSLPIAQLLTKR